MTHHHTPTVTAVVQTSANTTTPNPSNSKHFDQEHHHSVVGRTRASSTANGRNSERSRSTSNASVSSTTMYCDHNIQHQTFPTSIDHNQQQQYDVPSCIMSPVANHHHHLTRSSLPNSTAIEPIHHHHHLVSPPRSSPQQQYHQSPQQQQQQFNSPNHVTTTTNTPTNAASPQTTNVQQFNLLHPTPQQRLTIEKLLQIIPESVQSRNPKLFDLLVQLRRQYMWQAVTTPIITSDKKDNQLVHPLEKMKQDDAMVFSSHIDEICACVNQLLEELDLEEYGLFDDQTFDLTQYKAVWLQEEDLRMKAKQEVIALDDDENQDTMQEDEEECDEEEFDEEEDMEQVTPQPSSSTAPSTLEEDEESSCPPLESDMEDEESIQEESSRSEISQNPSVNAQSQDASNTKLQEFFRQLENVEPIPNGKLSFFQNHHLVVGKFDRTKLVENNILSCTVMKKSTLNVVVHRRCARLKKDNDRFSFESMTYNDKRILKKQSLAKSVVRFAKVQVDFGKIVDDVINRYSAQQTTALSTEENKKF